MQRELGRLADGHEGWPRIRVGVNSGPAMVRELGGSGYVAYAVVGDTMNMGSRLESNAPVGGVLIGASTYERLPDGTVVEPPARLMVKGRTEPIEAYVLARCPSRRRVSLSADPLARAGLLRLEAVAEPARQVEGEVPLPAVDLQQRQHVAAPLDDEVTAHGPRRARPTYAEGEGVGLLAGARPDRPGAARRGRLELRERLVGVAPLVDHHDVLHARLPVGGAVGDPAGRQAVALALEETAAQVEARGGQPVAVMGTVDPHEVRGQGAPRQRDVARQAVGLGEGQRRGVRHRGPRRRHGRERRPVPRRLRRPGAVAPPGGHHGRDHEGHDAEPRKDATQHRHTVSRLGHQAQDPQRDERPVTTRGDQVRVCTRGPGPGFSQAPVRVALGPRP